MPKRKAGDQSKSCGKRSAFGCKLATSTPEKEAALEKLKSKNQKTSRPKKKSAAVKKFALLFTRVQMITMMVLKISYHGESSDYEDDFSEMDCCSGLGALAVKDPETGDFVLVKLIPINSTKRVHYVGQITMVSTDEVRNIIRCRILPIVEKNEWTIHKTKH